MGYAQLVLKHRLQVVGSCRWTFLQDSSRPRKVERVGQSFQLLPKGRAPGDRDIDHLLFAVRYEGVDIAICRALFHQSVRETLRQDLCQEQDLCREQDLCQAIVQEVRNKPTSAFRRRLWFLWETLTGQPLPLPDLDRGNYVPLLDPLIFVTGPVRKMQRWRIDLNLLGTLDLAPAIRRTLIIDEALGRPISSDLRRRIDRLLQRYDDGVIRRALSFLYSRETMASFDIESERPSRSREDRFIALLQRAPGLDKLDKATLVQLQNETVDPRFRDKGWRQSLVYVGESARRGAGSDHLEHVHFVGPQAADLDALMTSFLDVCELLIRDDELEPVLAASALSFLFVLLHPFEDGNGRLHRWLIRWVLARRGVTPPEVVIPVSAVIQAQRRRYDETLETFSRPLLRQLDWHFDREGRMTVEGSTIDLYRHPDLTHMAETLISWLDTAIEQELVAELEYLTGFDAAKHAIQEVADMPDRLISLFIRLCRQGDGTLSARKRKQHFARLSDSELERMQAIVDESFPSTSAGRSRRPVPRR